MNNLDQMAIGLSAIAVLGLVALYFEKADVPKCELCKDRPFKYLGASNSVSGRLVRVCGKCAKKL